MWMCVLYYIYYIFENLSNKKNGEIVDEMKNVLTDIKIN